MLLKISAKELVGVVQNRLKVQNQGGKRKIST